jgi:hypothetical protein
MKRFLIAGSRTFNNYFIVYRYLKKYIPQSAIICNGGANGADQLAAVYAERNGHVYEAYPAQQERFGSNAWHIRNVQMVKQVDHAIFFWDGKSPSTAELITLLRKRNIEPIIVSITDDDIIKPHPGKVVNIHRDNYDVYIGRGNGSFFGNPFPITERYDREAVVAMFTDYVLKTPSVLSKLHTLKDKVLGCFCAPNLCHGDMIVWMLEHAYEDINIILKEIREDSYDRDAEHKNYLAALEEQLANWSETGGSGQVYTTAGTCISDGYIRMVHEGARHYLEISDNQIHKDMLWQTMEERDRVINEEPPRHYYMVKDPTKLSIFYQEHGFSDSPFETGRWYVLATQVRPAKD